MFCRLSLMVWLMVVVFVPSAWADEPLIKRHADWRFFASADQVDPKWAAAEFDDSKWRLGPAGFGYGDNDDKTVLRDMPGRYASVYIRRKFKVADVDTIKVLVLLVKYDDGFIAYLNGREVIAADAKRQDGMLTVGLHEAERFEPFEIKNAKQYLKEGENVLAIEGHNASLESSDFSLDPVLLKDPVENPLANISPQVMKSDLDEFERRLFDQSSYLTRTGFDSSAAIKELRESITDETRLYEFAMGLRKLVMRIGDCHADVRAPVQFPIAGLPPFRFADTDKGLAALKMNLDEPLDEECPYVVGLDGIPIEKWLNIAQEYVPNGSPQLKRSRSIYWMAFFDHFRDELNVARKPTVLISLASADRKKTVEKRLRLTRQGYGVGAVRLGNTRLLDGNIGYIRIPLMDGRLTKSTVQQIHEFRDTKGLVIDVRDNAGGTYQILRAIYPYFRPADAPSYVTNIAAYRLSDRFAKDHIAYRPTFRADWKGWTDEEREAIQKAAEKFKPEWQPPKEKFSEWHYMVLNRKRSGRDGFVANLLGKSADRYFHYDKPVVVLSNAVSFSATDGFLSAFADLPQVTIMGQPSGGGSGATRRFVLPGTGIRIALSSMASFRANGKTFDGNGIEVDVEAMPTLSDFTEGGDSVLDRAVLAIGG